MRSASSPRLYRFFFTLVLGRFDAESVHLMTARMMGLLGRVPGLLTLVARWLAPKGDALRVSAFGCEFPSPLGVAAGVDKSGTWYRSLAALGFGSVEVGTVTARDQEGNPRPRVTRLPRDRALLNAMGFPNPGAMEVVTRLPSAAGNEAARRASSFGAPIGVNIGKSKVVPVEDAVADYRDATRVLAPHADYLALNVSSPNTPGLRDMQAVETLRALIEGVRTEMVESGVRIPLLLKVSPDLADKDLRAIAELSLELGIDGIIAVNTTVDHSVAVDSGAELQRASHGGGVSGRPLGPRAVEILRLLHEAVGDQVTLVSVGGIETADDVWERVLAGATLVQAYTGFVYGGPLWPHRINRALERRLEESPWSSLGEAVGKG